MASSTDDDGIEEFVQDATPNKKVQSIDLKSGRLLGKGLSSIVYETTWEGKICARKDFLRVPSDIFEREAAVLVGLDHANLVRTYCWTVDEGSCSLVVDLMDDDLLNMMQKRKLLARKKFPGSDPSDASQTSHLIDLHKFIEDGKNVPVSTAPPESAAATLVYRFSMPEALHMMLQIAEGILFLHENGVAHGNLKPKNILVTPSGEAVAGSLGQDVAFKLKVADFGLFKTKIESKSLVSRQARKLEMVRWQAPELLDMNLIREDEHESFTDSDWGSDSSRNSGGRVHKFIFGKLSRADAYSFALTCSQILTGEDPYPDLGLNDLVRRIPNGLRPKLPRRCPPQLGDLINRCWGEEFKRPTFLEILSELKNLQASLTADSWVDIRKATLTGPDFEITLSVKYVTEKFAKNQPSETPEDILKPMARTLLRSSEIVQPMKLGEHSIEDSQESPKLTFVPKQQRRRKVYGWLGCLSIMPAKTISSKESEDNPTITKLSAKNVQRSHFSNATSKPFSPNDERYNADFGRTVGTKPYTFPEVSAMTRNFKCEIGKRGFGSVYYGKLSNGQEVAVKVGSSHEGNREFFNEINILSRIRHKNLVALVGYCQKEKYCILIYEYMENGSLYDHLFGDREFAGMLDWKMRLRIALNVAQGLEYLHTGCEQSLAHCDIKSSNILLSKNYDAKLTDFGLANLIGEAKMVNTMVKGTPGYFDPEYFQTNLISTKSDIYSFGVVLLELITGRPPSILSSTTRESLCDWVREALQRGDIHVILDPALKSSGPIPNEDALWRFAEIAMRCVEPKSNHRPTMIEVIQELYKALELEEALASTDPWRSLIIPEPYIKQSGPSKPIGLSSDYFPKLQPREKPVWSPFSTNSAKGTFILQKQRRRKAYSCLERFGCMPAKAVSMGKGNGDISTSSSWWRLRYGKSRADVNEQDSILMEANRSKSFTFAEVGAMTRDFMRVIGKGGFGPVYYGVLPDGRKVAVKVKDDFSTTQGEREFFNEIDILSRVHHKNLVALLGYCLVDKNKILIYEYMENGSLYDHLYGNRKGAGMLDWKMRLQIALNVAQGLDYLHSGCSPSFIHRDVKSKNILLSANYVARVADFGLSRLMNLASPTHVITSVMGTKGYLDPEYLQTNLISTKTDVYSFGVVLLELITGRPPLIIEDLSTSDRKYINLCDWVREVLQRGDIHVILDPALKSSGPVPNEDDLWNFAEIAMQCVEPKSIHRPIMSEVIQELHKVFGLEEAIPAPSNALLEISG